jgi:hypothetical protein
MEGRGLDETGVRFKEVADSCEHNNKHSGSVIIWNCFLLTDALLASQGSLRYVEFGKWYNERLDSSLTASICHYDNLTF